MKKIISICFVIIAATAFFSCRTTKQINKAIAPKDSTVNMGNNKSIADSLKIIHQTVAGLQSHYINYNTFSAKIKVEYEDSKGKQPDIIAVVRIVKDSAIWISLSATIFNVEVYRMLIKKDSVILMNTRDKEVQYRSLDYLQEVTQIPFDYKTLQDLLIGNPIFFDTSKIFSYKKNDSKILISSVGVFFKNLLTLAGDNNILLHSKLDDVDVKRSRTADITYDDYEIKNDVYFSTKREITVSEKNKLDIRMNYKQYEFNKELSVSLKVPKNYKRT